MFVYIVFYAGKMCWAFHTREQAEAYIRRAVAQDTDGIYNRQNLTIEYVDYLEGE